MENKRKLVEPTMEELFKKYPPKTDEEIGEIIYPDEDEEEELDTMFPVEEWEEKFYDDEGNWIGDNE